jgi:4-aminobutyrate aminotransferase-like enzyme
MDRETKTPAPALAGRVVEGLRERKVLISVCGPHNATLKIRPLLISEERHIGRLHDALEETLRDVEATL